MGRPIELNSTSLIGSVVGGGLGLLIARSGNLRRWPTVAFGLSGAAAGALAGSVRCGGPTVSNVDRIAALRTSETEIATVSCRGKEVAIRICEVASGIESRMDGTNLQALDGQLLCYLEQLASGAEPENDAGQARLRQFFRLGEDVPARELLTRLGIALPEITSEAEIVSWARAMKNDASDDFIVSKELTYRWTDGDEREFTISRRAVAGFLETALGQVLCNRTHRRYRLVRDQDWVIEPRENIGMLATEAQCVRVCTRILKDLETIDSGNDLERKAKASELLVDIWLILQSHLGLDVENLTYETLEDDLTRSEEVFIRYNRRSQPSLVHEQTLNQVMLYYNPLCTGQIT